MPLGAATAPAGGAVTFSGLSERITAGAGNGASWLAVCTFTGGNDGDDYSLSLAANADLVAVGVVTAFPILPSGAPVDGNLQTLGPPGTANTLAVTDLVLPGNVTVSQTASDVVVLRFRVTAGASENVEIQSVTLHALGSGNDQHAVSSVTLWHDTNSDGVLQRTADALAGPGSYGSVYSADNGAAIFSGLGHIVNAGASSEFLAAYTFSGAGVNNDRFEATFTPAVDLLARGQSSLIPATVSGVAVLSFRIRIFGSGDWTQNWPAFPGGYQGEHGHSAVLDEAAHRIVLFGGVTGLTAPTADAWQVDLTANPPTWTQMTVAGTPPAPRHGHGAVYRPAGQGGPAMIVFGGFDAAGVALADAWSLSLTPGSEAWTALAPVGGPPAARGYHTAVWDRNGARMIVFAGSADRPNPWGAAGTRTLFSDLWALDPAAGTWTALTATGTPPPGAGRAGHAAVYDAKGRRMIVLGGCDTTTAGSEVYYNDVTALDTQTLVWTALSTAGTAPSVRTLHSAVLDEIGRRVFVFAGGTDNPPATPVLTNTLHVFNLGSPTASWTDGPWNLVAWATTPPAVRYNHAGAFDPRTGRSFQFGGLGTSNAWSYR